MPKPRRRSYYEAEWVPGSVYHAYTSAVHRNVLFADPAHYRKFVQLLRDRLGAWAELLAYALIPNHLHLALRLPSREQLAAYIAGKRRGKRTTKEKKWLAGAVTYNQLIGDYFATLGTLYALYANPLLKRRGTLFNQTIRRIRVRDDLISRRLIMYIHTNEVKHGMLATYKASGLRTSYAYYGLARDDHWLARDTVLERFGGLEAFYTAHERYVHEYGHTISHFDEALYFDPGHFSERAPHHPFLPPSSSLDAAS